MLLMVAGRRRPFHFQISPSDLKRFSGTVTRLRIVGLVRAANTFKLMIFPINEHNA